MDSLRAAVVGVGSMGRHHARILSGMSGVDLVALVDPALDVYALDPSVSVLDSIDRLPEIDLAVVATPTALHLEMALFLARRGVHLLVEKPLAATVDQAQKIVAAASDAGTVLAVGHVERFNPAIAFVASILERPRLLQLERLSPYTPRIPDSVVFDLMIHDIDLACWIYGEMPSRVSAAGSAVYSDSLDVAAAQLEFSGGAVACLQASRITQDKVRRLAASEPDRYVVADSVRQDVGIRRQAEVGYVGVDASTYRQSSVIEIPYLDRGGEPLARELGDFVDAIRGRKRPLVTGEDGLLAVSVARSIEDAARR